MGSISRRRAISPHKAKTLSSGLQVLRYWRQPWGRMMASGCASILARNMFSICPMTMSIPKVFFCSAPKLWTASFETSLAWMRLL